LLNYRLRLKIIIIKLVCAFSEQNFFILSSWYCDLIPQNKSSLWVLRH
jgi:hypothetical protein